MFSPPRKVSTTDWLTENFYLPEGGAVRSGLYDFYYTPYFLGVAAALDDQAVKEVDLMKAAQIGWTYFLIGYIGKRIDTDPCPIMVLFAKEKDGKAFHDEKLVPTLASMPTIRDKVDVSTSRKAGNRWDLKTYPGGFLKLVGSNSPGNVKSTSSVGVGVVEEPDDTSENVKDQGDSIGLLEERLKRYPGSKLIVGGTPAVKDFSKTEARIKQSDARVLPVTCHECGVSHVLDWENVHWEGKGDEGAIDLDRSTGEVLQERHEIFGFSKPDTARYECPHCGVIWDDYQRQKNIRDTVFSAVEAGDPYCGWTPTREFYGSAGFQELSELYACLPGTTLGDVVVDYLKAEHQSELGDESLMIKFVNQKLGKPYEYASDAPDADVLRDKALDYEEMVSPRGGLIVTAAFDVQRDRVACVIRAWGRDEESWLLFWGEEHGNPVDKNDSVWTWVDKIVSTPIKHASGGQLRISAYGVDSSDGNTSDAVYTFVRSRQSRGAMAIKGSSNDYGTKEIFSKPKVIETRGKNNTKASKHGVLVYIVGTHKAKDLIAGRMRLPGSGPGRMHWYEGVRPDYYDQLLGEVKAPHRSMRGKKVWQQKSGHPIEAWDCEVYCLHAARSLKVHLMKPYQWDILEQKIVQVDLFNKPAQVEQPKEKTEIQQRHHSGDWLKTSGEDWI